MGNLTFLWALYLDTPTANKWHLIKQHRNSLLAKCDWTQLLDNSLTAEQRAAWADYRQSLRDLPQTYEIPDDVILPEPPNNG